MTALLSDPGLLLLTLFVVMLVLRVPFRGRSRLEVRHGH